MNRRKLVVLATCILFSISLAGCGDSTYALTDEEEQLIVDYAAKVVVKYDKATANGITKVSESTEDESDETQDGTEATDMDESSEDNDSTSADSALDSNVVQSDVSIPIQELAGVDGVTVSYDGYDVQSEYNDDDLVMLSAGSGYAYLILNFTISNTSSEVASIDFLSHDPVFYATVNGSQTAPCESTILPNDLSTLMMNLDVDSSSKQVLLFKFSKDSLQTVDTVDLSVTVDGTNYKITM